MRGGAVRWRGGGDGGAPGGEELGGDGVLPELGPGFKGFGGVGVALGEVVESGVGGIAEGAEHAGQILQGGLFGAAFGKRARGLALEVEDDEVAAGAEGLAGLRLGLARARWSSAVRRPSRAAASRERPACSRASAGMGSEPGWSRKVGGFPVSIGIGEATTS